MKKIYMLFSLIVLIVGCGNTTNSMRVNNLDSYFKTGNILKVINNDDYSFVYITVQKKYVTIYDLDDSIDMNYISKKDKVFLKIGNTTLIISDNFFDIKTIEGNICKSITWSIYENETSVYENKDLALCKL